MNSYIPHISPSLMAVYIFLWGEIGRQHVKAPLAADIEGQTTTPGTTSPTLANSVWVL